MLERLKEVPAGVDALRAVGQVSREDYDEVLDPLIDAARREGRRLRLLYEFGADFTGFTPGAAWEDAKVGLRALNLFDGCAVVTDVAWIRQSTHLASFFMPCPVRVFDLAGRADALAWLGSLPEGPGVSHRVLPSGVVVVEVREPLRSADFEALAATADSWLADHPDLPGLVVHASHFPGWENATGLLRHARFIRDHHRRIGRVALAADSRVAGLAPTLASHFVSAEVRSFGYDELDDAVAWAAGGTAADEPSGTPDSTP